jgi:hypothetical protein
VQRCAWRLQARLREPLHDLGGSLQPGLPAASRVRLALDESALHQQHRFVEIDIDILSGERRQPLLAHLQSEPLAVEFRLVFGQRASGELPTNVSCHGNRRGGRHQRPR